MVATTAGTQSTAPLVTPVTFGGQVMLNQVTVRIPPGHCGTTGLQVVLAGAVIFPYNAPTEWLIGDDYTIPVVFNLLVDTQLRIQTYNVDVRTHRHFLDIQVTDLDVGAVGDANAVALTGLS